MKHLILILAIILPISLTAQDEGSFGMIVEEIDSVIIDKVIKIDFVNYDGYIFPKEYGDIYYRNKKKCIDLDSSRVADIDVKLIEQYYKANKRFMKIRYQEMYDMKETNPDAYEWKELRKSERRYWKDFRKNKRKMIEKVKFSDRQYLGFINSKGEKIILIQLVDFREDPHSLRGLVDKQFISGWHGWFYSNISRMHFHVNSDKLTVNEDF